MGEEGVDELKLGNVMIDSLRKSFEQRHGHAQASSVLLLTQEHYEKVERDLEERARCLEEAEKVFEERRKEMALKEEKLSSLEAQIHGCGEQLDVKRKEVAVEEGRLHSCSLKLKSRKLELMTVTQSVSESSTQLAVIQKSIEEERSFDQERLREVVMKELQLDRRAKELNLKKKKIDADRQMVKEQKKELERKRKLLGLQENSLGERFRQVGMKEEQLQVHSKELESKEKRLDASRRAVDDQQMLLELKVKQLTRTGYPSDSTLLVNNGRSLKTLLNELLTKHALVHGQVSSVIKTSENPARLVLDAVQGSHSPLGNDRLYEPEIVRKSCILLLDQLLLVNPPLIEPHVQNAAIQLAREWKEKMKVGAEDQPEILGFLHLLAAFRISSAFRVKEYGALLDRVVDQKQALKLRHHLGMTQAANASSIPHPAKTEELGQSAVSKNGVNRSSHSAAAFGHTLSGWLNKRPRTTHPSHFLF